LAKKVVIQKKTSKGSTLFAKKLDSDEEKENGPELRDHGAADED
jgi:hypothetical protein